MHQPTARVIKIINELSKNPSGLNNANIARACDILPGTLHPILRTLCELEVCYCKDKKYFLADYSFIYERRISQIASQAQLLADELKMHVQIGVLRGAKVYYERRLDGGASVLLRRDEKDYALSHVTALGKALLAQFIGDYELFKNHLSLDAQGRLAQTSAASFSKPDELYENIKLYESLGYFSECGEFDEDFICFAVPIKLAGATFAAISVTVLKFHIDEEKKQLIVTKLRNAAKQISSRLS